jgi:hypothetical protein
MTTGKDDLAKASQLGIVFFFRRLRFSDRLSFRELAARCAGSKTGYPGCPECVEGDGK